MLSCKEITRRIASDELSKASFFVRLSARLHLLFCEGCRRYAQQLKRIKQQAQEQAAPDPGQEELEQLEATILADLHADKKE